MTSTSGPVPDAGGERSLVSLSLRLVTIGRCLAIAAVVLGMLVLVGYVLELEALVRIEGSLPPLYPVTAIALVLGGTNALGLRSPTGTLAARVATVAGCGLLAFGLIDLTLHLLDAPASWFDLWPPDPPVPATTPVPGRPVAETGLAATLLGLGGLLGRRTPRLAQALSLGAVLIGTSALLGYVVGVDRVELGASLIAVGMAAHTAVGLVLVGLAQLLAQPGTGLLRVVTDASPAGGLGRRLLLVVLAVPLLLAVLDALLIDALGNPELAGSFIAAVQVVVLGLLVLIPIAAVERLQSAAEAVAESEQRLVEAIPADSLVERLVAEEMSRPLPEVDRFTISVQYEPAHGFVTGDSYQFLSRDDARVLVAVIDVAGHGTEPGVLALRLRVQIETLWNRGAPLEELIDTLDDTTLAASSMASALLIELDSASESLEWINAGHPPALISGAHGTELLVTTGPVLGFRMGGRARRSLRLAPGSLLVAYTDGLTEAFDDQRRPLGEEAVERIVARFAVDGPAAVTKYCLDAAREHSGGRLRDDVLVLAVARTG